MNTAFITHTECLDHVTPEGHPECADRLRAVQAAFDAEDFAYLIRIEAPLAEDAHILRVHPETHLKAVAELSPSEGFVSIDSDTFMSPAR